MSTISSLGVGSGLDIESIITGLMEAESQPLTRLQSKETLLNAQISAYGSFKSSVATFQSAMEKLSSLSSFKVFQTSSGDESVFTASASSGAAVGSYNIDVTALAERDKLASAAFTDYNTVVGEGTLTISVGSDSFDVPINSDSGTTLADIRTAINNKTDNTGVVASIITDDTGARLVLTSEETGTGNAISVSVSDADGNNTDTSGLSAFVNANMTSITTAKNAVIKIDNFTVTSSSNTIEGAIDGVTINVKSLGSSTLDITRDDEAILESVKEFASAFNALRTDINTKSSGQLEGDNTLKSIERQIFDVFNSGQSVTGSSFKFLIEAGVSIDKEGVMSVDETKVNSLLSSDFSSFVNLFAAEGEGIANRLEQLADNWLETDGLIDAREQGLKDRLDDNQDQQDRFEARLNIIETRIRSQFIAMDTLVSNLNSQGSYLISQLSSLNNS